jgi:putative Holliday junction resolvase
LTTVTGRRVVYFDERYTTVEAEQRLVEAKVKRRKRNAFRDQVAAQILLQTYLDAGCPLEDAPAAPLEDTRETRS